jgi:hypothetical protein
MVTTPDLNPENLDRWKENSPQARTYNYIYT